MKAKALFAALCALLSAGVTANPAELFPSGRLAIGCNYWASHAGMMMWRNWNAAQVDKDIAALAGYGLSVMRVFPLWPDFQPLTAQYGGGGGFRGWTQKDGPLQNPACVDEEMMSRFRVMCDIAAKHRMKLVVGLVTGWMSGRMFMPPALERRNLITDPEVRRWQIRFVRHFVREMKDHPAIAAWDLGNECNCMGGGSAADDWAWMFEISSAIRLEDCTRPVVSGMHSLEAKAGSPWNLRDQGELMDVLTTHPYPLWTPNMNREPFNSLRNGLHASAESLVYAGVSGKPCFAEEAGDMGRNVCSEARAAGNVRNALATAWANGIGAYMWWCAFDQGHLRFPPYTWTAVECDLGLFRKDFSAKPVLDEMKAFAEFLKAFPYSELPPRQIDAVCLVNETEKSLPPSFGAFALSRQAGFDIRFVGAEGELPEAKFYIMPSGIEYNTYSGDAWFRVLEKVRGGATLLVSKGNEMALSHFAEVTGNEIDYVTKDGSTVVFEMKDAPGCPITANRSTTVKIKAVRSEVVGATAAGEAMVTVAGYGRGKVVYVNSAIECDTFLKGGAYYGKSINSAYLVYRVAAKAAGVQRVVTDKSEPNVGLTEHPMKGGRTLVVAVNYNDAETACELKSAKPVARVLRGSFDGGVLKLAANDFAVLEF